MYHVWVATAVLRIAWSAGSSRLQTFALDSARLELESRQEPERQVSHFEKQQTIEKSQEIQEYLEDSEAFKKAKSFESEAKKFQE